ncbi:Meiotic Sister-Chromatid recombination aldehyde dehydrogenase [Exophiala xenobiotica]|nr:Meiotic Sister-Chromatid recombination aldehyde dehydrogenase [Exophiala xenobiotica]
MSMRFNFLAESISSFLEDEDAWAFLLLIGVLSIVTLWVTSIFLRASKEHVVRFSVPVPPQLRSDWGLKDEPAEQPPHEDIIRNGRIYPQCPADGRPLGPPIDPATDSAVDSAISSATQAQLQWSRTSFSERRRVLRTLLRYILDHQEEIVAACCLDSGKTKIDACFGEILVTVEKLQWTIKHGEKALRPTRRPTNLLMCYKANTVIYEPLGVVAACMSWNYPFHNFISPIISGLFAGNAVIVKPSEQTCWSTFYFTDIVRGALQACGHSTDLVQNIICLPDVADHLTSHTGLSHITFIGSREVAHKVCASAARALTPVTVELGGKDASTVLDDAKTVRNVDDVISILMRGVFQSAGQNCIGTERVIALPDVHDKVLHGVRQKVRNLRLGSVLLDHDTPDMGSMISSRSFDKLENLIADAVEQGATLHCGGRRYRHPKYPQGTYFQPTLLSGVTKDMQIAKTELFAPVFLLMKAADVDDAIAIANSTEYALGASVFGHDSQDVSRCVQGIKAGMVAVNDFGAYYACSMPFGGVKGSGYGRFGGEEGLRALCNVKSVCQDAWWARTLGIQTRIPPKLQYPVSRDGWEVCKGVIGTGYALRWSEWVWSVYGLVRNLMRRDPIEDRSSANASVQ